MASGVLITRRSVGVSRNPRNIKTPHKRPVKIMAVLTAVLTSCMRFAPKYCDTMTEVPILQPKANAR